MYEFNPDYSKRDYLLPPGCKDLIDVIKQREKAKWMPFFDRYRKHIYDVARKVGLTDGEAQEVVQDVIKAVAPNTGFDPAMGSLKGRMIDLISRCIFDKWRKKRGNAG